MTQIVLDYDPQPRQALLHETPAKQIFYGGAAGGGKSHSLRWDAITFCLQNPGLQAYLFRRTLGELYDSQIQRIQREVPPELGEYKRNDGIFAFKNGSNIHMCYCEREKDVTRYQSSEMHWLGIDEAGHMTEFQITYLRGRVRLGSFNPPQKHLLPRICFASNPGGPGHSFLKKTFIDPGPPETFFYDETMKNPKNPEDRGWLSIFIPARMRDNKFLDENYAGQFAALSPELERALTEGDWDAVVGAALHNLSRDRHRLRPFTPPRHWTKFMSMDWGTARPFSIGWYCVSDGAILSAKPPWPEVYVPSGAVIRYKEWYGWTGKTNQGLKWPARKVAQGILEKEDGVMDYRIADTGMWAQHDGPSAAESFMDVDPRLVLRKSKKDRKANYEEILSRLAGNDKYMEDGIEEVEPMFYVTANCVNWWRTVPILTLDENDPDKGPAEKLENHCYDETVYALRSRPFVTTESDRWEQENWDYIKQARKQTVDPYATR